MPAFAEVEIDAETIADAMNNDGYFMSEVLTVLAERIDMGMMRDNASDIAAGMTPSVATFLSRQFTDLGRAIKDGHNMANLNQILEEKTA